MRRTINLFICAGIAHAGAATLAAPQPSAQTQRQSSAAQSAAEHSTTAAAPKPPAGLPKGSIVAFLPRMSGTEYNDGASLRRWLDRQGWAICDGSNGTPDLRQRMLLGTDDPLRTGQRLGSRKHEHRVRGDSGTPVHRNRSTPTGRLQLKQIPDDQHRHRLDLKSDRAEHLPPSLQVLFILKVR